MWHPSPWGMTWSLTGLGTTTAQPAWNHQLSRQKSDPLRAKSKNKNKNLTEAFVATHIWGDRVNPGNLQLPMGEEVRFAVTYDLKCPIVNQKLRRANNWQVGWTLKGKTSLWKLTLRGPRCWIYQTTAPQLFTEPLCAALSCSLQVASPACASLNPTPGCKVTSLPPTYLHVPKCLHQGNDLQLIQCGQVQDLFDFRRARETKTTLRGAGRPPFRLPIPACQVPGGLY